MDNIKFYEIDNEYIEYLSKREVHLFNNKNANETPLAKRCNDFLRLEMACNNFMC